MVVGSFGETQKFEGSHGTSTLPVLYLPEKKPESLIFVGDEMAQKMRALYGESQAWLNDEAWLDPANHQENDEDEPQPEYQPANQSDQIPF